MRSYSMNKALNIGLQAIKNKKEMAFINLRSVSADVKIIGNLCYCEISQQFVNTEEISVEAVYSFPLPMSATICSFSIFNKDKVLESKIAERESAFDKYDEALLQGNRAYLLDQDRPNLFTTSVGNLTPGQDIIVKIGYVQLINQYQNICKFILPTTLAPVYTPPNFLKKMDPAEIDRLYPPISLSSLPYGLSINIDATMPGGIKSIDSPSHAIKTQINKNNVTISFSNEKVAMDRDFILEIEGYNSIDNKLLVSEDRVDRGFIALSNLILPEKKKSELSRNIVFLIDCSGSMSGERIVQAKNALYFALSSLLIGDNFNIIAYGSDYKCFSDSIMGYNENSLNAARNWVNKLDADMGGTEIFNPIKHIIKTQTTLTQDVILLTDGEVGNQEEIINYLRKRNNSTRFFTIGVGTNSGEYLLKSLAEDTKGFMEIINNNQKIETILNRQYSRIRTKSLKKVELIIDNQSIDISYLIRSVFYNDIVNFFIHLDNKPQSEIDIIFIFEDQETIKMTLPVDFIDNNNFKGLEQLYAKFLIDNVLPYYVGSKQKVQKNKTTEIALKYSILSENTSFVIEETLKEKSNQIALRRVPVMLPIDYLSVCNSIACSIPTYFDISSKTTLMRKSKSLFYDCCESINSNYNDNSLIEIINLQTAQGYWDDFYKVSKITKISRTKFNKKIDSIKKELNLDDIFINQIALTVLVLEYFKSKHIDQIQEWSNVANKAYKFISDYGYEI